ncbi:MAG TPA: molybdate ABC transporter substrate-binding protein, partial [Terracidiphilus sp.]
TFLCALALGLSSCHQPHHTVLTLSVAASLQDAVQEIEIAYQRAHPDVEFRNNFGSSGTLAREIENGAPVDAFLSAGETPMAQLEKEGLLAAGSRIDLLRNNLVLIAPRDSKLKGFEDLRGSKIKTVALGDPASVPAGHYGEQTLRALGLYDTLRGKLVLGKDVRQVLAYVETGNADAGLVYSTDVLVSGHVRVVETAPESAHDPIVYPAAVLAGAKNAEAARAFLVALTGPDARDVFVRRGFRMAH